MRTREQVWRGRLGKARERETPRDEWDAARMGPAMPPTIGSHCVQKATPVGFEPTQGDPIGLAGRRLSHSAKVSSPPSRAL